MKLGKLQSYLLGTLSGRTNAYKEYRDQWKQELQIEFPEIWKQYEVRIHDAQEKRKTSQVKDEVIDDDIIEEPEEIVKDINPQQPEIILYNGQYGYIKTDPRTNAQWFIPMAL